MADARSVWSSEWLSLASSTRKGWIIVGSPVLRAPKSLIWNKASEAKEGCDQPLFNRSKDERTCHDARLETVGYNFEYYSVRVGKYVFIFG